MVNIHEVGYKGPSPPPEINMKIPSNHLDFSAILPLISNLEELILCFRVKQCGIDFRWNMFGMTIRDADNLAMGLRICRKLRKLKIHNSKIDDDKFYAVYDGIKGLAYIESLSFPNNGITDDSMECLAKLLTGPNRIRKLDLTNNLITCEGAKHIADVLNNPKGRLEKLNLALNSIRQEGCSYICKVLETNTTVSVLNLSSNRLALSSCKHLGEMLRYNRSLKQLDLSCNHIEEGGARILYHEGIKNNNKIRKIDIRLTGCGREVDLAIQEALRKNRTRPGAIFSTQIDRFGSVSDASSPARHDSVSNFF